MGRMPKRQHNTKALIRGGEPSTMFSYKLCLFDNHQNCDLFYFVPHTSVHRWNVLSYSCLHDIHFPSITCRLLWQNCEVFWSKHYAGAAAMSDSVVKGVNKTNINHVNNVLYFLADNYEFVNRESIIVNT
jgi:hypothetical protein